MTLRAKQRRSLAPLVAVAAIALVVQACDSPTSAGPGLIQTGQVSYTLVASGDGLEAKIDYVFTNLTEGRVYLVNCNGGFALALERQDGDAWKQVWAPLLLGCLSAPIVIERGATLADTIRVWGAPPGANADPRFDRDDPSGVYRIVWINALSSFQDHLPFGPQIPEEYRISNSFLLSLP